MRSEFSNVTNAHKSAIQDAETALNEVCAFLGWDRQKKNVSKNTVDEIPLDRAVWFLKRRWRYSYSYVLTIDVPYMRGCR